MEKAYAKMNVNYSNLNAGNPSMALRELTGMPVDMYDSLKQTKAEFINIVKEADDKHWIITAACMHDHTGLVPGHAYTLIGITELKNAGAVTHQLVKLRNPWGRERYTGPWNDHDPAWTADYKL